MKAGKSRLLKKMLFNKILISIIPICFFLVFVIIVFSTSNQSNFKKIQQNTLSTGTEELVGQYENLLVMRNNLSENVSIMQFIPEDYENEVDYDLLDVMKMGSLPRTFYAHFWLAPDNHKYMYSATGGTASVTDFNAEGTNYFTFSEYTNEELRALIQECRTTTVLPVQKIAISEKTEEYVVILMPVTCGGARKATLLAFIPARRLCNFIGGSQGEDYGNIFVDQSGNIVYSDFSEELSEKIVGAESGKTKFGYHVFRQDTYFFDLTVYRLIDASYASQDSIVIYIAAAAMTLACLVYVTVYILYSIKTEYAPIRTISENCAKYMYASGNAAAELNEIQILSNTLDLLREARTAESVGERETETFGNGALKNALLTESDYWTGEENEKRRVMLLFSKNMPGGSTDGELRKTIENYFAESSFLSVKVEYTYLENYYVFAVRYRTNTEFNGFLNDFSEKLRARFSKERLCFVISEYVYEGKWSSAYCEAKRAAHYMIAKCLEDDVFVAEEMYVGEEDDKELIDLLNQLDITMRMRDVRKMNKLLDSIVSFILNPDVPWSDCSILFNYMKNSILRLLHGVLEEKDFIKLHRMLSEDISNVSIMVVLIDSLKKYLSDYLSHLDDGQEDNRYDIEEICGYIEAHFMEKDFSLNSVSAHFSISVSLLSRIFKEQKGINFKEYEDILVTEKAKELLLTTDKTVEEIARELNYSNASNFLRAFKRRFGMSAGQYRKTQRGN